jgi:hypothetical protein
VGVHLAVALALACSIQCSKSDPVGPNPPTPPVPPLTPVLVGAGDIADCTDVAVIATGRLIDGVDGTVFTTGDNVYNTPTADNYLNCYGPNWGRHLYRTHATPGNHDYDPPGPFTYFQYFGSAAGEQFGLGYYSYNLGGWHILALDSDIPIGAGSSQLLWVESELAANKVPCTIAYWHHPLFSSAKNGPQTFVRDLWRVLYKYGVDVVMNGHDHVYERFAPQDPDGKADAAKGIRQFTVGTGGASLYYFNTPLATSESRALVHGVLKIGLQASSYTWEFIPVSGQSFRDSGTGTCR